MINLIINKYWIQTKKILIFTGTPGVGKGTYGKVINNYFKFNYISPG